MFRPLCSSYSGFSKAGLDALKAIEHVSGSPAGVAVRGRAERLVPRKEDVHVAAILSALVLTQALYTRSGL